MKDTPLFVTTPPWLVGRPSRPPLRSPQRPRCCAAVPPPAPAPPPTQEEVEKLFSRLTHVNKNLRVKASATLAENATDETIARLIGLLSLEDTVHRRAAVQTLGMTGMAVLPGVVSEMRGSGNSTVRASCAKVLAAVALYFPERRAGFPADALDALEAALRDDPDPVTKLATVGCLGTLGSDLKSGGETLRGCDRAVGVLLGLCGKTADMAVGATAVGAVAQIGQNAKPERKERIVAELKALCEGAGEEGSDDGFSYVREMACGHVDQLVGGSGLPDADDK